MHNNKHRTGRGHTHTHTYKATSLIVKYNFFLVHDLFY